MQVTQSTPAVQGTRRCCTLTDKTICSMVNLPDAPAKGVGQGYFTPVLLHGGFLESRVALHHPPSTFYSVVHPRSPSFPIGLDRLIEDRVSDGESLGRNHWTPVELPGDHL